MIQRSDEKGATLLEYAVLVVLIGVIAIVSLLDAGENAADTLCTGAGHVRNDPAQLRYNSAKQCCGYYQPGIGGGFVCVK